MIKPTILSLLLISALSLSSACSSDQALIEKAVQQTVEAQQNADAIVQPTAEEAQPTSPPEDADEVATTSTPSTKESESESQSSLIDALLGKWVGESALEIREYAIIESLVFYHDLVIFNLSENEVWTAFYYEIVDEDSIQLKSPILNETVATVQISQESPDVLNLTFIWSDEPDEQYKSNFLLKGGNVETSNIDSVEEAVAGEWLVTTDGGNYQVEFLANHMWFSSSAGGDFDLQRYTFKEPNQLEIADPFYPDDSPLIAEIAMPNEDILVLWMYSVEFGRFDVTRVMERISTPLPMSERPEDEMLYPVTNNSGCGYIDQHGKVVVEFKFAKCGDFYEGLAAVAPFYLSNPEDYVDYWGYIDNSGQFVIDPQFGSADSFNDGLARVRDLTTGKVGYIDTTGEYVIAPQYDNGDSFSEGLAHVGILDPEWAAFIDKSGSVAFELTGSDFPANEKFQNGLLRVSLEGYMDRTGELVIRLSGVENKTFSEGMAAINPGRSGCYYINPDGETIIQTDYSSCGSFSEGLAGVWQENPFTCGYIDREGNLVIGLRFEQCSPFSEGRARVRVGESYGYIDTQGNYIFNPYDFAFANDFQYGLARVGIGDKWGYIDLDGNFVLEP